MTESDQGMVDWKLCNKNLISVKLQYFVICWTDFLVSPSYFLTFSNKKCIRSYPFLQSLLLVKYIFVKIL